MKIFCSILGLLLLAGTMASEQSSEERAAARDIIAKRGDAVVMVLATLKLHLNMGGREQNQDQAVQTNATVLDATGLAVTSLTVLQPDDAMTRSLGRGGQAPANASVTSETADVRMRLADGREVPARIVLRDTDLDLVFLKPTEPLPSPIASVDAPSAKPAQLDVVTLVQRTSETTSWKTSGSLGYVQLILDKPRLYYQVAVQTAGGVFGSPLFDTRGGFVGVFVYRSTGSRTAPISSVLAADEIREVAKQAAGR